MLSRRRYEAMETRVVILADFDYFFAQCEELRNPALKGKPVVVGVYSGRTENSGAVSTANYVAREYGVKSGIPLYLAKKRLEGTEATFLPVDDAFYERISDKIMQRLRGYAESFEQTSIDEAYLDVTSKVHGSYEATRDLVKKMKKEVKKSIGITFSVGVGPNKLVAKIAADSHKPDGLTVVKPEEVGRFLSSLPVSRLLGVGQKTAVKLGNLGVKTIGELADYDVQQLVEVFGKKLGVYFHNAARGLDNEPVQETGEAESISRIATLKENTCDLMVILEKTDQLIEDIHKDSVKRNISFRQVSIIAIMTDLSARSRSKTLETATHDIDVLKPIVRELFEKFLKETELKIRRVGVKISGFVKEGAEQKQLTSFFPGN
ncbi:DNA polymerase IV [Candidatus Bathyarchaeota archaeon]|nr:DNA polymerase IV [Candidatus Bathyarchaeota archaeon]